MAIKRQTQALAEMERMSGRRVGRIVRSYQSSVISPLVKRIKNGRSLKGMLRVLGPGCLKEMDTERLETALADDAVQAGCVGRISALPGGEGRRDGGT